MLAVALVLLAFGPIAVAQPAPPVLTVSQMAAADLGRRQDALQARLDDVRAARDESARRTAMLVHWQALQRYMAQSLQLMVDQSPSRAAAHALGCGLADGHWRDLSFPGQLSTAQYLRVMQAQAGRMEQDVQAMRAAPQAIALEALLREHWRANFAFLQGVRGLGWSIDGWMPIGTATRALPEPESEGAILVAQFCSACHAVPPPRSRTGAEWVAVADAMRVHIRQSETGGALKCVAMPSDEQMATIRDYLVRHAR